MLDKFGHDELKIQEYLEQDSHKDHSKDGKDGKEGSDTAIHCYYHAVSSGT